MKKCKIKMNPDIYTIVSRRLLIMPINNNNQTIININVLGNEDLFWDINVYSVLPIIPKMHKKISILQNIYKPNKEIIC